MGCSESLPMATHLGTQTGIHTAPATGPDDALPTKALVVNTAAFAVAFAAWVMFGPSVRVVAAELGIDPSAAALLKAAPILVGSVLRIPVGILADRVGARITFPVLLVLGAVAAFFLSTASSYGVLLTGALLLGAVGTTFAVGVQSVSSWTSKARQGLALGIFGAGNVGTAMTTLGMPLLLVSVGWREAFQLYGGVLLLAAALYPWTLRDAPRSAPSPSVRTLLAPIASLRVWCLGLYYTATFGVFVAATLIMTDVYVDDYGVPLATAGMLATTFTFTASLCRIAGGGLADRIGPRPVLKASLFGVFAFLAPVWLGPPLPVVVALVFVAALGMGLGMAATFKLIPAEFPTSVGAVGGIVGALGGLGGFVLPLIGAGVGAPLLPLVAIGFVGAAVALIAEVPTGATAPERVERPATDSDARRAS
jgi:MFS transporter, NNP family, nitrate/nitrite transporter